MSSESSFNLQISRFHLDFFNCLCCYETWFLEFNFLIEFYFSKCWQDWTIFLHFFHTSLLKFYHHILSLLICQRFSQCNYQISALNKVLFFCLWDRLGSKIILIPRWQEILRALILVYTSLISFPIGLSYLFFLTSSTDSLISLYILS